MPPERACTEAGRDPRSVEIAVRGLRAREMSPELVETYAALGVAEVGIRLPMGTQDKAHEALHAVAETLRLRPTGGPAS